MDNEPVIPPGRVKCERCNGRGAICRWPDCQKALSECECPDDMPIANCPACGRKGHVPEPADLVSDGAPT